MVAFTGGDKFRAKMSSLAKGLDTKASLRVGFLAGSTYPDGTPVAMVAAINEFGRNVRVKRNKGEVGGDYYQLPRPFFRNMIADKQDEWPDAIAGLLKNNKGDAKQALEVAGAAIAGQLRQSIIDLVSPPLAPSTIKAKGTSKPLIEPKTAKTPWGGLMLASVRWEVNLKKQEPTK